MMAQKKSNSQKPVIGEGFFLTVILILIFAMAARTPLDTDMWWHLRAGEETWQTGRPVTVDTFSYTRQGETWINHSWLSQVGMYLIYRLGGFLALGAAVALLAVISMGLVYAQMVGHPLARGFVLMLTASVAAKVWTPRPQLASLVLFGLIGYLLYQYKWKQRDHLWLFIPVFILWSNLHGGYVLGLLLIGAMLAGEVLNNLLGFRGQEVLSWKKIGKLVIWGLAAGLVVVINPNGLAMWAIPFQTVNVGVLREFIVEWASPDFHEFTLQPFLWLLLGTLGLAGISGRRLDGSDLASVAGFAYLAFLAQRNFGPFAMVAAPVLSRHLVVGSQNWRVPSRIKESRSGQWWANLSKRGEVSPRVRSVVNGMIVGLISLAAVVKLFAVASPQKVSSQMTDYYPVEAVRWLQENRPSGRLFNSYNWGGYLIWELRDYPIFVDGRTDLYNDALLRKYLQVARGQEGYAQILDEYQVKLVLAETDSGLTRVLDETEGWKAGFRDDIAAVFVRKRCVTRGDIRR
jgi:hypothetical protein